MSHHCEKLKKEYYLSMNPNKIVEKKSLWKTITSFPSSKNVTSEPLTVADDDDLITHEQKVAYTLNDFFSDVVTYTSHKMLILYI